MTVNLVASVVSRVPDGEPSPSAIAVGAVGGAAGITVREKRMQTICGGRHGQRGHPGHSRHLRSSNQHAHGAQDFTSHLCPLKAKSPVLMLASPCRRNCKSTISTFGFGVGHNAEMLRRLAETGQKVECPCSSQTVHMTRTRLMAPTATWRRRTKLQKLSVKHWEVCCQLRTRCLELH